MTQAMAPATMQMTQAMAPTMMKMALATTTIPASGVQVTNSGLLAVLSLLWIDTATGLPSFVESVPPLGTSSVISPFVNSYYFVVVKQSLLYPFPGYLAYSQQYQSNPGAPISRVTIP